MPIRRGAQSGASPRYRMKDDGQSTNTGFAINNLVLDDSGCRVYTASWGGSKTVFRPFPGRDPDNPNNFDPFRHSDDPNIGRDFGDWIRRYDAGKDIGYNRSFFIIDQKDDTGRSPLDVLFTNVDQAVKSGKAPPAWAGLLPARGREGVAPLSSPTEIYLMQGVLFMRNDIQQTPPVGMDPTRDTIVLMLTTTAGNALVNLLEERDSTGRRIRPQDITDLAGGSFIEIFMASGSDNPQLVSQSGGSQRNRYAVQISETFGDFGARMDHIPEITRLIKPWDDVVKRLTIEEQVVEICNSGLPAAALTYGLGTRYGDMIPQKIWDQAGAVPPSVPTQVVSPQQQQQTIASGTPGMLPNITQPNQPAGMIPTGAPVPQPVAPQSAPAPQEVPATPVLVGQPASNVPQPVPAPAGGAAVPPQPAGPQPTHATAERAQATQDALTKAREAAQARQRSRQ